MGAALRKDVPDPRTGLTEREQRAIQATWKKFVAADRDYGIFIFSAMFVAHPEYIELFRKFRGKSITKLQDDPEFRAHGCAVGYQLTSMVDSVGDSVLLEALIRKNAIAHLERVGVHPFHFQSLGRAVIDSLKAKDEKSMNLLAVGAWDKMFAFMLSVTVKVFEECPQDKDTLPKGSHADEGGSNDSKAASRSASPGRPTAAKGAKSSGKGSKKRSTVSSSPVS